MLNFCKGFTSYWTCLESLKNHYPVDSAIHLSYNRPHVRGKRTHLKFETRENRICAIWNSKAQKCIGRLVYYTFSWSFLVTSKQISEMACQFQKCSSGFQTEKSISDIDMFISKLLKLISGYGCGGTVMQVNLRNVQAKLR